MYTFGMCFYTISNHVGTSNDWILFEMIGMYSMAYGVFAHVDNYGAI